MISGYTSVAMLPTTSNTPETTSYRHTEYTPAAVYASGVTDARMTHAARDNPCSRHGRSLTKAQRDAVQEALGARNPHPSLSLPCGGGPSQFRQLGAAFFFVFFFLGEEGVFNGTLIREPKKTTASDRELQACFSESETNLAII